MKNRTRSALTAQAKDMTAFCIQAVQALDYEENPVTEVLSVVVRALLRPRCEHSWGRGGR
jgi:hypothetical protein